VLLFDNHSAGWRRFTWFVVQAIPAGTIHIAAIQSRAAQSLLREEAIIGAHGLVWFPSGEHPATGIEAAAAVLRLIGGGWRLVGSLLGLFSLHHRDRREPRHSPFTLE
jgi:predicted DCC family thiol-disulfide oxidoreductase YuxK